MANRLGRVRLLSHSDIDKPQTAPSQYEVAYKFTLSELILLLVTKTTADGRQLEKPKAQDLSALVCNASALEISTPHASVVAASSRRGRGVLAAFCASAFVWTQLSLLFPSCRRRKERETLGLPHREREQPRTCKSWVPETR